MLAEDRNIDLVVACPVQCLGDHGLEQAAPRVL